MKKIKKYNNHLLISIYIYGRISSCSAIVFHIAKSFTDFFGKVCVVASKPKRFNSEFTKFELKKIDYETDLHITRLPLLKEDFNPIPRIFNAFILGIFSLIKIIFGNYKVVIATTSPPILTAFIIAVACKIRRIRFIYYCMDINPEIGLLSGDFRNTIVKNILLEIDKFTCRQAKP